MKRIRLVAVVTLGALGLVSGCSNVGNGQLLSRLGFGSHCPGDPCIMGPECPCAGGPMMDGQGPVLPPAEGMGMPPMAPSPRPFPPQAQPTPADPTSKTRGN